MSPKAGQTSFLLCRRSTSLTEALARLSITYWHYCTRTSPSTSPSPANNAQRSPRGAHAFQLTKGILPGELHLLQPTGGESCMLDLPTLVSEAVTAI